LRRGGVISTEHNRAKAVVGVRTAGTWLLIAALVLCSAFSVNADCYKGEHATSALQLLQIPEIPPSGDDAGDAGDPACHCMCQHFCGVILAASLLLVPGHPADPIAALADLGIAVPPSTPLRPPRA
jgi:hypothetical protein